MIVQNLDLKLFIDQNNETEQGRTGLKILHINKYFKDYQ